MFVEDTKNHNLKVPTVSRVLPDGRIVELVYSRAAAQTMLAVHSALELKIVAELPLATGEVLVPVSPRNNLIRHGAVLLAETAETYGDVSALVEAIEAYIHRYVDVSDEFRRIASHYVLLTWVYDAFAELPYLRLRGDFGSGKTRALLVVGSLCYKAFFASGASTVSPIFHTLDTFGGTLILDEADFRFSDEKSELVKIFNNGNVRGFPVLRTAITVKREFDPRAFSVFGPKILAMRRSFEDQALESRFLTEEMGQRSLRPDIPINLPEKQKDEALRLRNKLLSYRFDVLASVAVDDSLVDPELSPRLNQILVPLLSLIQDQSRRCELRRIVGSFERQLYAERSNSPEAGVLEVLTTLLADETRRAIPIAEITAAFVERFGVEYERPISNRYVGGLLRTRLRLLTYKSHGSMSCQRVKSRK